MSRTTRFNTRWLRRFQDTISNPLLDTLPNTAKRSSLCMKTLRLVDRFSDNRLAATKISQKRQKSIQLHLRGLEETEKWRSIRSKTHFYVVNTLWKTKQLFSRAGHLPYAFLAARGPNPANSREVRWPGDRDSTARLRCVGYDADDKISILFRHFGTSQLAVDLAARCDLPH